MKTTERKHVSLYTSRRPNGKVQHTVCWRPSPGKRERLYFNELTDAVIRADQVERMMEAKSTELAEMHPTELADMVYWLRQFPDPATFRTHMQSFFDGSASHAVATVLEVAEMFKISRQDRAVRTIESLRIHVNRFCRSFGERRFDSVTHTEIKEYLTNEIGGAPKSQNQHLITLRAWWRWAHDFGTHDKRFLPFNKPMAPKMVEMRKVTSVSKTVFTPEEFTRLLVFTPADMVVWAVIGHFGGIRAAERERLTWSKWHEEEGNQIVCDEDITKTAQRRLVDVTPNLTQWLTRFRGEPRALMCSQRRPYRYTPQIAAAAGVPWLHNALRHGFASFHLALHQNAALTAEIDGHTVQQLRQTYKSIKGVTKARAEEMFSITPETVIDYAKSNHLPDPAWVA